MTTQQLFDFVDADGSGIVTTEEVVETLAESSYDEFADWLDDEDDPLAQKLLARFRKKFGNNEVSARTPV